MSENYDTGKPTAKTIGDGFQCDIRCNWQPAKKIFIRYNAALAEPPYSKSSLATLIIFVPFYINSLCVQELWYTDWVSYIREDIHVSRRTVMAKFPEVSGAQTAVPCHASLLVKSSCCEYQRKAVHKLTGFSVFAPLQDNIIFCLRRFFYQRKRMVDILLRPWYCW